MGACVSANAKEDFPSFHANYRVGAELGKGSFGSVFWAEDKMTCEVCSVKVQKGRETGEDNIKYEATLWKQLDHKNCVGLLGVFQEADVFFTVMELCHCSLWDRLVDAPKWSVSELIKDIKQMLTGISYMHNSRIVHRDIKPDNILYGGPDSKTLKIADFGLAHQFTGASRMLVKTRGSAAYMAPEMLAGEGYTYSVDIWSFGVLCYMILLGQLPCGNSNMTSAEMKQAILEVEGEPRRLTRLSAQLKGEWEIVSTVKDGDDAHQAIIFGVVPGQPTELHHARMLAKALVAQRIAALDFVRDLLQRDVQKRYNVNQALRSKMLCNIADPLMTDNLASSLKTLMIVNRKPVQRRKKDDAAEEQRKAEAKAREQLKLSPVEGGHLSPLPEILKAQAPERLFPLALKPPPGQPAEVPSSVANSKSNDVRAVQVAAPFCNNNNIHNNHNDNGHGNRVGGPKLVQRLQDFPHNPVTKQEIKSAESASFSASLQRDDSGSAPRSTFHMITSGASANVSSRISSLLGSLNLDHSASGIVSLDLSAFARAGMNMSSVQSLRGAESLPAASNDNNNINNSRNNNNKEAICTAQAPPAPMTGDAVQIVPPALPPEPLLPSQMPDSDI